MLIYACVSGHGFGHGSRVAAVLTALHQRQPSWRLVHSTPLAPAFLQLAFGPVPFEQRACRWDVGVIQADALGADAEATLAALEQLQHQLPDQIEAEARWIRAQHEPVLVLGDVAPSAAALARRQRASLAASLAGLPEPQYAYEIEVRAPRVPEDPPTRCGHAPPPARGRQTHSSRTPHAFVESVWVSCFYCHIATSPLFGNTAWCFFF